MYLLIQLNFKNEFRQTEHEFKEYKKIAEKGAKEKDLELKLLQDKVTHIIYVFTVQNFALLKQ